MKKAKRISVVGTVQGVGFRPFVYRLADKFALVGSVQNRAGLVEIEVCGQGGKLEQFLLDLVELAPPLSRIQSVDVGDLNPQDFEALDSFVILTNDDSSNESGIRGQISGLNVFQPPPPDSAVCADCIGEFDNVLDRRYQYPFTNCTNCGPRFTIIEKLPYEREKTTMKVFPLCKNCLSEYESPLDRRFHAEPIACPNCGPALRFLQPEWLNSQWLNNIALDSDICDRQVWEIIGKIPTCLEQPLAQAVALIKSGGILALRGLGGYQLVVDASNEDAVCKLRERKGRYAKPFAVMMENLEAVRQYCYLNEAEATLLKSVESPIVLLELKAEGNSRLSKQLAPANAYLGVMLPYTPLHVLLMRLSKCPLVMTSGNASKEPIAMSNAEALCNLSKIADGFLLHNRDILARYDDSLVCSIELESEQVNTGKEMKQENYMDAGKSIVLRRARGYAPRPITLERAMPKTALAFGAHLKNTFAIVSGAQAFLSPHIGDMENYETVKHFESSLKHYLDLFCLEPEIVACDMHPDYASTTLANEFAQERGLPLVSVQHHHAHILSCMAEHHLLEKKVLGLAFDGIGYGADGSLWGGEFLLCEQLDYKRIARFAPVKLAGGVKAIKEPWRVALAYLAESIGGHEAASVMEEVLQSAPEQQANSITKLIEPTLILLNSNLNVQVTSSLGRLFDAMASLLGLCQIMSFEGEAALQLQSLAAQFQRENPAYIAKAYPVEIVSGNSTCADIYEINWRPLFQNIVEDIFRHKSKPGEIALRFHYTLAEAVYMLIAKLPDVNTDLLCLSGGVFQNKIFTAMVEKQIRRMSAKCYFQEAVPANDGGLSLGQAVFAARK